MKLEIIEIKTPIIWILNKIQNSEMHLNIINNRTTWSYKRMSSFIELIFLGFPIHNIYLTKQKGNYYKIVTGYQEIRALYMFYESRFFLTRLENLPELYDFAFFKLSDERKKQFLNYKINIKLISGNKHMKELAIKLCRRVVTNDLAKQITS